MPPIPSALITGRPAGSPACSSASTISSAGALVAIAVGMRLATRLRSSARTRKRARAGGQKRSEEFGVQSVAADVEHRRRPGNGSSIECHERVGVQDPAIRREHRLVGPAPARRGVDQQSVAVKDHADGCHSALSRRETRGPPVARRPRSRLGAGVRILTGSMPRAHPSTPAVIRTAISTPSPEGHRGRQQRVRLSGLPDHVLEPKARSGTARRRSCRGRRCTRCRHRAGGRLPSGTCV